MNNKSQSQSVGEVFRIGFGILLLSSVIFLFYSIIIPNITNYSLKLEAKNINSNVNLLLSRIVDLNNYNIIDSESYFSYSLPNNLENYQYSIQLINNEICTFINKLSIKECKKIIFPNDNITIKGVYLSGGYFNINLSINSFEKNITITN